MIDYSFIRLEDSLEKAKQIKNSPLSSIELNEAIQLLPCEQYTQITNTSFGISFDGDYQALLIDCDENVKADITDNFYISEFIDKNGINQIEFVIYKIGLDFYKRPLRLKLIHTTGSDIYYSNDFYLTNYQSHKTSRFEYRNNTYFKGISYDKTESFQSIRLQLWFANLEDKTEVTDYYQISNGNTISDRPLYKQAEIYKSDFINNFVYERANIMLLHDIIYVDGVRVTNKTTLENGEFIGDTNYYKSQFSCFKNYNDKLLNTISIVSELDAISFSPNGIFTTGSLPTELNIFFNRNIQLSSGNVKIIDTSDESVLSTLTADDFTVNNSDITADITGIIFSNGTYRVEVSSNIVKTACEINNSFSWEFTVQDGEYDSSEYDNTEYLVN